MSSNMYSCGAWMYLVTVTLLSCSSRIMAFCPHKCVCDNENLQVTCYQTKLKVKYLNKHL